MALSRTIPRKSGPQDANEEVILVVGESFQLSVLLRQRPFARLVVFRELLQALDYLRHNRVTQVFIDPAAFGAASEAG